MSLKTYNTFLNFQFFKTHFKMHPIVFSNSTNVMLTCKNLGILVLPIPKVNRYGIPIVRNMLIAAKRQYKVKFYAYVNSDILINPYTFPLIKKLHFSISTPVKALFPIGNYLLEFVCRKSYCDGESSRGYFV